MRLIEKFKGAIKAQRELMMLPQEVIDSTLRAVAQAARSRCDEIIEANRVDLAKMDSSSAMYDRLLLDRERIDAIACDLENIASLHNPVGEILSRTVRPNGMEISKVRVPFGLIGVIYEARPNVTFDVFGLCFKSQNCCMLKGGSDAYNTNKKIVEIVESVLTAASIDRRVVTLLPADREATAELLSAVGYVDLIIPRGSASLINYVRDRARVPVIETGAGICHTYVDREASDEKAADIIFNAKCRRVSVCNALDSIVIHSSKLGSLGAICERLSTKGVVIEADERAYAALDGVYPGELLQHADNDSFGTEFLGYRAAIKCVDSIAEAIDHVCEYSSGHSEAIITESDYSAQLYTSMVDAACLYVNVSTAFTDGAQFGFGAEIGISTQKLHARGPMALPELTTYKYIITGTGQVRQ